jgi:DHA1 family multidrug resistance protein-like MFS transporter
LQFVGQVLYNISGRRIFSYPEEKDGFDLPEKYKVQKDKPSRFGEEQEREEGGGERERRESDETAVGQSTSRSNEDQDQSRNGKDQNQKDGKEKDGKEGKDGEKEGKDGKDDTIMVDWYSDDDPENPQNWYVPPPPIKTFNPHQLPPPHLLPHQPLPDIS